MLDILYVKAKRNILDYILKKNKQNSSGSNF